MLFCLQLFFLVFLFLDPDPGADRMLIQIRNTGHVYTMVIYHIVIYCLGFFHSTTYDFTMFDAVSLNWTIVPPEH
jgi:hypothetical protein